MNRHEDLEVAIQHSLAISDHFSANLSQSAELDNRGRLANAYLCMALDHREAILLLVHSGAHSSATALQRPLLEAFVTGAWLFASASEEEIQGMLGLTRPTPKFESMSQRLRKTHDLGEWFEHFRKHYDILGDYTHGHQRQLSRWLGSGTIEPRHHHEQMIEVLHHCDVVGLLAAVHREKIAGCSIDMLMGLLDDVMQRARGVQFIPSRKV